MANIIQFEEQYKDIADSELWKLFKKKVEKENLPQDFLIGVGTICEKGIILSKDIIRFFPNFTLHDITHIRNVCKWMINLLGTKKNNLSAADAALLLMAACCHDIGMSVSKEEEFELVNNPESTIWKEHFRNNPYDEEEYQSTKIITSKLLRNYIRKNHHKRISEHIKADIWPSILTKHGIARQNLINLCQSHGESLTTVNQPKNAEYDLRLCAVLLRLSDILDFDPTRAPEQLYQHLGLTEPADKEQSISQIEWLKNQSGGFGKIHGDTIDFWASYSNLELEMQVEEYKHWVIEELSKSIDYLAEHSGKWSDLELPQKINSESVERIGYKFGDFHLTMDQDRVLQLFTGQNIYNDPGVFVRELLQNSIDAILSRKELDRYFTDEGKIIIKTWHDNDGYDWFRIEDNGTGMDEDIITKYFLKVGKSYYTSDDFRIDRRHYAKDKSDYNPISRFGIGILSCFMSDPDDNRLEISTKRYSHNPDISNPAIRLNVDGLHGYYYLAQEQEQNEHDIGFKPMHSPDAVEEKGYRSEVGTTICVRTHLYQLNNGHSFKKIIDKYVQFPDVKIEYFGPEGHKIYTSKNDLDLAINHLTQGSSKNGTISISHDFPEAAIKEIEQEVPSVKWIRTPRINLKYYSINALSVSNAMYGAGIFAKISIPVKIEDTIVYDKKEYTPTLYCCIDKLHDNSLDLELTVGYPTSLRDQLYTYQQSIYESSNHIIQKILDHYSYHATSKYIKEELYNNYKTQLSTKDIEIIASKVTAINQLTAKSKTFKINIRYDDWLKTFSPDEARVFIYIINALIGINGPEQYGHKMLTAYNGILADSQEWFQLDNDAIGLIILLSGEKNYPEVNIARDGIKYLPLTAALDLDNVRNMMGLYSRIKLDNYRYELISEKEYYDYLENNPQWESMLTIDGKTAYEISHGSEEFQSIRLNNYNPLLNNLYLAIIKRNKAIMIKMFRCYRDTYDLQLGAANKTGDSQTMNFPVQLFVCFSNSILSKLTINHYFNIQHRFSQWLIKYQNVLQEKASVLYHNLILKMLTYDNVHEFLLFVNNTLSQLQNRDVFGIKEDLFLNESDFFEKNYHLAD